MTPLTLSLVCLALVAISGNFISIVRENKILSSVSILPAIYILSYGLFLIFGSINLYEDAAKNFFLKNPEENKLPTVFIILKFYKYILVIVGVIFIYLFSKYLIRKKI